MSTSSPDANSKMYKLEISAQGRDLWDLLEQIESVRLKPIDDSPGSLLNQVAEAVESRLKLFGIKFTNDEGACYHPKSETVLLVYSVFLTEAEILLVDKIFGVNEFAVLRICRQPNADQPDDPYFFHGDLTPGC